MPHCETFLQALRRRGYRITPQREMIVRAIAHSGRHMTAEEVLEEIREQTRSINLATVYRTLDLLVEEGLASRADLGGGRVVYATARHGPHVHLVCRHCGRVIDADIASFDPLFKEIEARYGFTCHPQHFALYGLCEDCRAREERGEGSADPD
ncbi:MAG TPA: transcriptional repressor [Chloroflexi bacterium]|nr:transcriptional repressor [Chloroflexota bacterium]